MIFSAHVALYSLAVRAALLINILALKIEEFIDFIIIYIIILSDHILF